MVCQARRQLHVPDRDKQEHFSSITERIALRSSAVRLVTETIGFSHVFFLNRKVVLKDGT